ncbi:hypothetical protein EVAR_15670_1 [Eumeta japonica]|uniref:Uncharacterized protein n=1 Tax=Eumeta variegata TaxID=151549 RepID=A0A4C1UAR9_EUMVA|nr:hypothetical protein EVAR_15670_1 [Eumeta japonica]
MNVKDLVRKLKLVESSTTLRGRDAAIYCTSLLRAVKGNLIGATNRRSDVSGQDGGVLFVSEGASSGSYTVKIELSTAQDYITKTVLSPGAGTLPGRALNERSRP